MPEPIGTKVSQPTRGWNFELIIKDKDYSADLYKVRIISSIALPYQTIFLDVFIDQDDIILDKMYGQDKIKLTVRLLEQDRAMPHDDVKFELMYVTSYYPLIMKRQNPTGIENERVPVSIVAVPREAFKTATSIVNKIYLDKKPKEIIEDLVSSFTKAKLKYDSDGVNPLKIDQVIVPPIPLIKSIKYLDETFGLFKGPYVQFIDKDNKLHIVNLNKKFTKSQTFTVYQLTIGAGESDIIDKCNDGKNFYTYDNLESHYSGNTKFTTLAKNQKFIVKPRDTLSYTIEHDLTTIMKDNALVFKNPKTYTDTIIDDRTRVYSKHTGYDYDEVFAIAGTTPSLSNMSGIALNLEKNLPVLRLMEVGEIVKINSGNSNMTDLTGKYILKSSDLSFNREGEWQCTSKLFLIRSNKTI